MILGRLKHSFMLGVHALIAIGQHIFKKPVECLIAEVLADHGQGRGVLLLDKVHRVGDRLDGGVAAETDLFRREQPTIPPGLQRAAAAVAVVSFDNGKVLIDDPDRQCPGLHAAAEKQGRLLGAVLAQLQFETNPIPLDPGLLGFVVDPEESVRPDGTEIEGLTRNIIFGTKCAFCDPPPFGKPGADIPLADCGIEHPQGQGTVHRIDGQVQASDAAIDGHNLLEEV